MTNILPIIFCATLFSTQALAGEERNLISIDIRTPRHQDRTSFVDSNLFMNKLGKIKSYEKTTCSENSSVLGSVNLFEGESISARLRNNVIHLRIEEYTVFAKDKEIAALPKGACTSLVPEQRITFERDILIPDSPIPSPVNLDFGGGYSIKYMVASVRP
jgi:hypothetical protein